MQDFTVTVSNRTNPADPRIMPVNWNLLAIDIIREVNRIPRATLTLNDGDVASNTFPISDSADHFFDPGQTIRIEVNVTAPAQPAAGAVPAQPAPPAPTMLSFEGLVMTHAWEADNRKSTLTLSLKDRAVTMTQLRKSEIFANKTDEEVAQLLFWRNRLTVSLANQFPRAAKTQDLVQYECSDWDFMLVRAEANGILVSIKNGAASMKKLALSVATATFDYGRSEIYSVEMEATADRQFHTASTTAWDVGTQKLADETHAADPTVQFAPGDLTGPALADLLRNNAYDLLSPAPLTPAELQAWADAALARSRLALVRGRISVAGTTAVDLLDTIKIAGVGEHFGGAVGGLVLVTGVRHRINNTDGWVTDIQFGLADEWFAERPDVAAAAAAGLIPPISGMQVGVVEAYADSHGTKELRVRVKTPAFDFDGSIWARVAYPDAGNGRGFFARPEIGDEVVLGFFNGDPRQPVIVGSLYSSKNAQPADMNPLDSEKAKKGWHTRSGLGILFDDDARTVLVSGKSGNKMLLDDKHNSLCLSDANGNTITLDKNGITLTSCKDVTVAATAGEFKVTGKNFSC